MSEQIESVSPASWIRERDIDLLVVEEFRASSTFRDLLLNALNLSIDHVDGANISAQISVEAAGRVPAKPTSNAPSPPATAPCAS